MAAGIHALIASTTYFIPSSRVISFLLCPDKTRQYLAPRAALISIAKISFSISLFRKASSGIVKSGEAHIIGITMPVSSTAFRTFGQLARSFTSAKLL